MGNLILTDKQYEEILVKIGPQRYEQAKIKVALKNVTVREYLTYKMNLVQAQKLVKRAHWIDLRAAVIEVW